ncbi:hypothetical protein PINS_up023650 [Pythium insidiosum]|nr:hypothetical protein PINS_up023650 [Pythium insidiosum]
MNTNVKTQYSYGNYLRPRKINVKIALNAYIYWSIGFDTKSIKMQTHRYKKNSTLQPKN